jgi:PAS domain S-box-containing protein
MFGFGKNKLPADVCSNIVERFEDGIVAVDGNHTIILFNEGARRIFGYAPEEALGQHLNILLPERSASREKRRGQARTARGRHPAAARTAPSSPRASPS